MFRISARTVLELGSELISSDIIAFYELLKNSFDAHSKNGVEIRFRVPLRRNTYLRLLSEVEGDQNKDIAYWRKNIKEHLDPSAGKETINKFCSYLEEGKTLADFTLAFTEAYRKANTVEIIDSGSGMSMNELNHNYLVIGTPARKKEVDRAIKSGKANPPYLGEKGIGRLSAMRLGNTLNVETAKSDDTNLNILDIDWRLFDDVDAMVEDIDVKPFKGRTKSHSNWSGTRLTIGDLSEDWTEERVKTMAEYSFSKLIDPFADPKRRPRIAIFWNENRISIPWMDRALLEHAHATIKGGYSIKNGEPVLNCSLTAVDLGFPHPREIESISLTLPDIEGFVIGTTENIPPSALMSVGPFEFEAYWYNRRRFTSIESIGDINAVRELQRKWSGILLFRDSFRVFPYGEDEDDWLALDRKALGRPGYTLNKAQFVGKVNISRTGNPALLDQTNREGLRAGPEHDVFVTVLQHVIQVLLWEFLRDVEKRYKKQSTELGDVKAEVSKLESRAKGALSRLRKIVPKEEQTTLEDLQHAFLEFQDLADRAQKRVIEVEDDSKQMIQMAGVGLMVEVVAHELARASENALKALEALRGKEMPTEVRAHLETLRAEMKSVGKRLRILDPLSISGRQRSEIFDLQQLLLDIKEAHAAQFQRHNIRCTVTAKGNSCKVRAVKGMIVQILENLISNSVYWIQMKAARESRYVPNISIILESDPITIFYSDNGRGIAPENREKVFRAFWSLKEKTKRRGLGLFIARECAIYLGGSLALVDRVDLDTKRLHEFVFELPQSASVK